MVETRFDKIVVRSKLPTPFASAEAFGAGAGRALQRTGAVMANVADKALAELDRQKQKDAVNKGMQFENSFDKLRREKVNSDYLTRKGQAALGTTAAWEKDAEEWYNQQKELVTNDYDQKVLDEIYRRRNGATLDALTRFEAQEKERYYKENTANRLKSALDDALANYKDDRLVAQAYNSGLAALRVNYADRPDLLSAKEKEYKSDFYKTQTLRRADDDAVDAAAYYQQHKTQIAGSEHQAIEHLIEQRQQFQAENVKKELKKTAMMCIYGDSKSCQELYAKAQSGQMSVADIEAAMPANAGVSFKNLIYKMNGYKTGLTKLDDSEKLNLKQKIYETIGTVTSNANAKIEDFQEMQNLIFEGLDKKALSNSEGTALLNNIAGPLMEKWKDKIEVYSDNAWFEADLGVSGLNDWLEENYLTDDKIIKKESKERQKVLNAANDRVKTEAYQLYYEYLQDVVNETPGMTSVKDVLNLSENKRRAVYRHVQERVMQDFAVRRYQSLRNMSVNPTYILNNRDGMVQISNRPEEKKVGKPLSESRVVKVAYDKASGKYGLVMADGTIKEVSREVYQSYGGKN